MEIREYFTEFHTGFSLQPENIQLIRQFSKLM